MSNLWTGAAQHPLGEATVRVEHVPTSELVSAANPGVDQRLVKEYAESMKTGWRGSAEEPIELHRWEHGRPFLNDGSHRAHAAAQAGISHLETEVFDHGPGSVRPSWLGGDGR